jgi:hypothetical protein
MPQHENDLNLLKKKYEEYLRLNYIKSRQDPDEEPYKTKYEARKLIETILNDLESNKFQFESLTSSEFLNTSNKYDHFYSKLEEKCQKTFQKQAKHFLIYKLFEFNFAKNLIETEEVEQGEKIVSKILREIDSLDQQQNSTSTNYDPLVINFKLNCFNELIFVWSSRTMYRECLNLIQSIEEIYEVYHENSKNICEPFMPVEIIILNQNSTDKKREKNFESVYTHSLFFIAQIYGKLNDSEKSAYYVQLTLQRHLAEFNESITTDENNRQEKKECESDVEQLDENVSFNPLDWATHSAALSQYYLVQGDFATTRHCLSCADAILNRLNADNKESAADSERLNEQTASIKRCWGKYAIELLKTSKQKLLASTDKPDQKCLRDELDLPSKFVFNLPQSVYNLIEAEKKAITSNLALDYDQARSIFLKGQSILNESKNYFILDGFVTDHCEIVRDLSELFCALLFYEESLENRCKMQKRRLDLLIPTCDEISEQYYLTMKRQFLFDIGSIYSDMMDLKLEILNAKTGNQKETINPKDYVSSVQKINTFAKNSIERFEKFLDTMKVQPERKHLPEKFDEHNVRSALLAKFYIGRLYSKIVTKEPQTKLDNMKLCLENYRYLVDYCDKEMRAENSQPFDCMRVEYNICKEMAVFLPAQMEKIRAKIY